MSVFHERFPFGQEGRTYDPSPKSKTLVVRSLDIVVKQDVFAYETRCLLVQSRTYKSRSRPIEVSVQRWSEARSVTPFDPHANILASAMSSVAWSVGYYATQ